MNCRWDKLQKRIGAELYSSIIENRGNVMPQVAACFDAMAERRPPRESLKALAERVYQTIMHWDIRQVGKLRGLFPEYFPKSLRTGHLDCYIDEHENWVIESGKTV
jgi:hypothetical protein